MISVGFVDFFYILGEMMQFLTCAYVLFKLGGLKKHHHLDLTKGLFISHLLG